MESTKTKKSLYSSQKQMVTKYFNNNSKQLDQNFVEELFLMAETDQQLQTYIEKHSRHLLLSSQAITKTYLLKLLAHPRYYNISIHFIKEVILLQVTLSNRQFELSLIQMLPDILTTHLRDPTTLTTTITYLALKMRSFDLNIRVTALLALKGLGLKIPEMGQEWEGVFAKVIPTMIEKEQLVREVSYTKGLFLHILEDQFNQVRKTCIEVLILFKKYIRPQDLKLIIIYMLNDEHELVREETLISSKHLKDQQLSKEDLQTLLMCLREKRATMRKYVYQTLSQVSISSPSLLTLILEKTLNALDIYKSDKKPLFRTLMALGRIYYQWVGGLVDKLGILEASEPDWQSTSYRAKMVFCYYWWLQLQNAKRERIPFYLGRRMLYLKDAQSYLFEEQLTKMEEEHFHLDVSKIPSEKLFLYIQSEEEISQQFHKNLLAIIRKKRDHECSDDQLLKEIQEISILFTVKREETEILKQMIQLIQHQKSQDFLLSVVKMIINNREKYEDRDAVVERNLCKVSKMENSLIVATNNNKFQQRVFLKCELHRLLSLEPKFEYKRLIELNKLREDEQKSYFSLPLNRYSKVDCILIDLQGQRIVLSEFIVQGKF